MVDSCRECTNCRAGYEQYCLNGFTDTYNGVDRDGSVTQGGYSTHVVVDERFVLRIPEAIPFEKAAPLLCAGITAYSPLRRWNAGPGKKVAVMGLGGLGHMAVRLAHALGAEVTVLSRSMNKKDDALRLGADHYYATSDPATFENLANTFDLIVNTVSAPLDLDSYLRLLAFRGTIVSVGAPPEPVPVTLFTLFENGRSFAGSKIGASPRPRRCSTSARSTASHRTSRSSAPTRSTRHGTGSSPRMCDIGSWSTTRRWRAEGGQLNRQASPSCSTHCPVPPAAVGGTGAIRWSRHGAGSPRASVDRPVVVGREPGSTSYSQLPWNADLADLAVLLPGRNR